MTASAPPRAVLDANILSRILLTPKGFSAQLLDSIVDGDFMLVTSEWILGEVAALLAHPRAQRYWRLSTAEIASTLDAFRRMSLVVPGEYEVFVVATDPKDNPILACALEGRAQYVVTDDRRDLLPLKHWRGVQIVSAPGFLRLLRGNRR